MADEPEYYSNKQYVSTKEALEMFKDDDLVAKPGSKFVYTTHGWTLIAAVIEAVGGAPFEEQLKQFLKDLGMHRTCLDENPPIIPNRSKYYVRKSNGMLENVPEVNCSYKWAGGGLLSTVFDLLRFGNVMLYCQTATPSSPELQPLLSSDTMKLLWTPVTERTTSSPYGLGWAVEEQKSPKIGPQGSWDRSGYVVHTGAAVGASSVLAMKLPHQNAPGGTCLVVLVNLQECGGLSSLAAELLEVFQ